MDLNSRVKQIEDLECFVSQKNRVLNDVLKKLGWTEESLQDKLKVPCPRDPGHWIPESSVSKHVEICNWVKDGYSKDEMERQPPSSKFFYQNAPSVIPIILDKDLQARILSESGLLNAELNHSNAICDVPKTVDRWTVELNSEQRLAIYDSIVREGKAVNKPKLVTVEDLLFDFEKKEDAESKPKSKLELLAELRDYKRRRQSYRAKNVHITKKSYTEIMKEVIENQITFLTETRKQENSENSDFPLEKTSSRYRNESSEDERSSYSSRKHDSHHRDRSESYSPKRRKHKRDRSRSRSHHKHKKSHKHKKKKHD